jgi:thioredoxin 1
MRRLSLFLLALHVSAVLLAQEPQTKDIYPKPAQAGKDLTAALATARHDKKRVILDFGANWCGDCHVLDRYFQEEPNAGLVKANFVVVHVNVDKFDKNKDIALKYKVPLDKGIPALAVLDTDGKLLYSQADGQFESMRTLKSSALTVFLNQWKPSRP